MKAVDSRSTPSPSSARHLPASGLRRGRIHATKGSAAQILRKIGVTQADERVADRALTIAAAGPKAKTSSAPKETKKVVAVKRIRPATAKNR